MHRKSSVCLLSFLFSQHKQLQRHFFLALLKSLVVAELKKLVGCSDTQRLSSDCCRLQHHSMLGGASWPKPANLCTHLPTARKYFTCKYKQVTYFVCLHLWLCNRKTSYARTLCIKQYQGFNFKRVFSLLIVFSINWFIVWSKIFLITLFKSNKVSSSACLWVSDQQFKAQRYSVHI